MGLFGKKTDQKLAYCVTAASGMGFEFTPVIGELSGKYLEYVSMVVPPRSCVVALAKTFKA